MNKTTWQRVKLGFNIDTQAVMIYVKVSSQSAIMPRK